MEKCGAVTLRGEALVGGYDCRPRVGRADCTQRHRPVRAYDSARAVASVRTVTFVRSRSYGYVRTSGLIMGPTSASASQPAFSLSDLRTRQPRHDTQHDKRLGNTHSFHSSFACTSSSLVRGGVLGMACGGRHTSLAGAAWARSHTRQDTAARSSGLHFPLPSCFDPGFSWLAQTELR